MIGRAFVIAGVPIFDASPSESSAGIAGLRERAELEQEAVDVGRDVAEVGDDRRHLVRQRAEPRSSSGAARAGTPAAARCRPRGPRAARRWPRRPRSCSSIADDTCARSRASGAMIVSESTASCSSCSFWRASSRRTSSTSLSAGLARRMTSLRSSPRPARPTPSSLRMIERRSRSGSRMMLLSRSRSTDCSRVLDRQQVLALARAVLDPAQRARRLGVDRALLRRLALDELLADQRLRADRAAARRRGSPGSPGRRSSARPRP